MRRILTLFPLMVAMALVAVSCAEARDTGFPPPAETEDAGDDHGGGDGGSDQFDPSPEPQTGPDTELTIQAKNITFNRSEMLFQADAEITLTFENLDTGIPHNVGIYADESADEEVFAGEIFPGVETMEYMIPATPAGEYYFQCDVHPNMNGTATFE